jgi:hypothetical protein
MMLGGFTAAADKRFRLKRSARITEAAAGAGTPGRLPTPEGADAEAST